MSCSMPRVNRRHFLAGAAAVASVAAVSRTFGQSRTPATTRAASTVPSDAQWHDVRDWGVEGRAFDDTESYFDRLPARAKGVVRKEVWELSRHSTSMCVRFETDADAIYARYDLTTPRV